MGEKYSEVIEQYGINVIKTWKGRGALLLKCQEGQFILHTYFYSPIRLAYEYEIKAQCIKNGFSYLNQYVWNKENSLISYDKYKTPFVMEEYIEARECNLRNIQEMKRGATYIAKLHNACPTPEKLSLDDRWKKERLDRILKKRTTELKRIHNYMIRGRKKAEFDLLFLSLFDEMYEQANKVTKEAEALYESDSEERTGICHGACHQHNILMKDKNCVITNFEHFYVGNQISDLNLLLRKALEKNEYKKEIFTAGIEEYQSERKLTKKEEKLLYLSIAYPEKFWKIANQYYNAKKCWIAPKTLEKLKKIEEQNDVRNAFLKQLDFSFGNI